MGRFFCRNQLRADYTKIVFSVIVDYKKFLDAQSLLVVGGGPVGVELAAEIITDFPKKKVTLVHAGDRLIEFLDPKASVKAENWLKSKGVEVILNDRVNVDEISAPNYLTINKKEVQADAHFVAVGKKVGSKWLLESPFLKDKVNIDGRLHMEPTTQVAGVTNIFAAGDITDYKVCMRAVPDLRTEMLLLLSDCSRRHTEKHIEVGVSPSGMRLCECWIGTCSVDACEVTYPATKSAVLGLFQEIKQGFTAGNQAVVVIQNIKKLIKNPNETKLSVYIPLEKPMGIVTLGRVDAVAQLPFATIVGWVPGLLKSKDLFVGKARKALGLKSK